MTDDAYVLCDRDEHGVALVRLNRPPMNPLSQAMLAALPKAAPGLTQRAMMDAVKPHLDPALFPGGKTSGWWVKCVQLDMEAKRTLVREKTRPLRWHLAR